MFNNSNVVRFPNPLAPGIWIQIHVSWGTLLFQCLCGQVEEANFVASRTNKFTDQSSAVEIAVIVDDVVNRAPRFLQAT